METPGQLVVPRYIPVSSDGAPAHGGVALASTRKTVPFRVQILSASSLLHPPNLVQGSSISHYCKVSFYDARNRRFFGSTITLEESPVRECTAPGEPLRTCPFDSTFFFHSSLCDLSALLVIELCAHVHKGMNSLPSDSTTPAASGDRHVGIGWTVFRCFKHVDRLPDTTANKDIKNNAAIRLPIYRGSPRALLSLTEPLENSNAHDLFFVAGSQLAVTLATHRPLTAACTEHLLPENVFVPLRSTRGIPGLDPPTDLEMCTLAPRVEHYVHQVCISVDNSSTPANPSNVMTSLDEALLSHLNALRRDALFDDPHNPQQSYTGGGSASGDSGRATRAGGRGKGVVVLERRLLLGVHNGLCPMGEPRVAIVDGNPASQLTFKGVLSLDTPRQSDIWLTFELVYRVDVPGDGPSDLLVAWSALRPFQGDTTESQSLACRLESPRGRGPSGMPVAHLPLARPPLRVAFTLTPASAVPSGNATGLFSSSFDVSISNPSQPVARSQPHRSFNTGSSLRASISRRTPRLPTPSSKIDETPELVTHVHDVADQRRPTTHEVLAPVPVPVPDAVVDSDNCNVDVVTSTRTLVPVGSGSSTDQDDIPKSNRPRPRLRPRSSLPSRSPSATTPHMYMSRADRARIREASSRRSSTDEGAPHVDDIDAPTVTVGLPTASHTNVPHLHAHAQSIAGDSAAQGYDEAVERGDPMRCDDIAFQFLAFTPSTHADPLSDTTPPVKVRLNVRFYRFDDILTPPVSTLRSPSATNVDESSSTSTGDPSTLLYVCTSPHAHANATRQPGLQVRYRVDSAVLGGPGETRHFRQHLTSGAHAQVDILDDVSLQPVGCLQLSLHHLVRGGRDVVSRTFEVPVVATDSDEGGHRRCLEGVFTVRLVNVGRRSRSHSVSRSVPVHDWPGFETDHDLPSAVRVTMPGQDVLPSHENWQAHIDHESSDIVPVRARPMVECDQALARLLVDSFPARLVPEAAAASKALSSKAHQQKNQLAGSAGHGRTSGSQASMSVDERDQERKRRRMEAVRARQQQPLQQLGAQSMVTRVEERVLRERALQTIAMYRTKQREVSIASRLTERLTSLHELFVDAGEVRLVEYELRNPYSCEHSFSIETNRTAAVRVVTRVDEWRALKLAHGVTTPAEEGLVLTDSASGHDGGPRVLLAAHETVLVPIRVAFLQSGSRWSASSQDTASTASLAHNGAETACVTFANEVGHAVAVLRLVVHVSAPVVERTLSFCAPEHQFMRRVLPTAKVETNVMCSDETCVCETAENAHGVREVRVRFACGAAPNTTAFYVFFYEDTLCVNLRRVWRCLVRSMHRVDVVAKVGESTFVDVPLRRSQRERRVRCVTFTPHDDDNNDHNGDHNALTTSLLVGPASTTLDLCAPDNIVRISVKPRSVHTTASDESCSTAPLPQRAFVHVVDDATGLLVNAWLILCTPLAPTPSKHFDVILSPTTSITNKRITYTNPYSDERTFTVSVSDPYNRVSVKQRQLTDLPGHETRSIGLRIVRPSSHLSSRLSRAPVYVFINNASSDQTEECFSLSVVYQ